MRKKIVLVIGFSALLLSLSSGVSFSTVVKASLTESIKTVGYENSTTPVGGIIWENTTWTLENSPYIITDTVQIPENVTLTIEPGVTVTRPTAGDMFLLHGIIYAHGTIDNKITFDGGGNSNFFSAKGSNVNTFLDLDYCIIRNGDSFWPPTGYAQYGHFSLKHSELTDLTSYSYVWYPGKDVCIEYNKFINTAGFSIGHSDANVYIRYNLFKGNRGFVVKNWASYGASQTVVKYNSFIDTNGIVLELPAGYDSAAMTATENYWGTNDTDVIDSMIYDKNDDITCAGYIDYLPILSEPHPAVGTYVGGHISENTTWAFTDIPYIVVEDVVVEEGVFLMIEPGVVVKFAGGTTLVVDGVLIARGSTTHRIIFTCNSSTPNPGDWKGIKFRGSSAESILNWTIVEYAGSSWYDDWAVYIEGSTVSLVNSVVRSNIYAVKAHSGAFLIVQKCNITNNIYGIYSESETEIYASTFSHNEEGVRIGGARVEVYASTFSNNGKAIREYVSGSYLYMTRSEISNNVDGVCWVSHVELSESVISHNNGTGIISHDWDSFRIINSTISGNKQNGITCEGYNPAQKEIHFSNIFNNTPYDVVNNLEYGLDISATYNWWGTTNETLIEENIYDYYDDYNLGKVLYKPYLMPPVANFTFTPETPYAYGIVTFDASASFNPYGSIKNYTWDFDDGNVTTTTFPVITHMFTAPGNYNVTLTVTDEFGLTNSTSTIVTVLEDDIPPVTTDDYDGLWYNSDFAITLTATDYESGVAETYYRINGGPVKAVSVDGQPYITTEGANNTLEHWSVDNAGNEEPHKTLTGIKLDKTAPTANAGQDQTVNVGETVTFDASGSTDNVGIVSYEWNFGDGTPGTGVTATHTYTSPGNYTVTLTVKDAAGNTATHSITVTVLPAEAPPPPAEAFPMWIVGAVAAIAAIGIAVATTILWKRRK